MENIPKAGKKFLLVGNHQIWALDVPLKFAQIYLDTGIYIRSLTDRSHSTIPCWKHIVQYFGGVPGTRENCKKLMDAGEPILVYPGGALEVWKDERIPKYTLIWKDRVGFAKMAAEHGYVIIPFASVGFEDMIKIAFSIPAHFLWKLLGDSRSKKPEPTPSPAQKKSKATTNGEDETETENDSSLDISTDKDPIVRSKPPRGIPPPVSDPRIPVLAPYVNPQSTYLWFGEPIDASKYSADDEDSLYELRDRVREAVEGGIQTLLRRQKEDPGRFTFAGGKRAKKVKKEQ
ncbi:Transmembrane protein 68 [Blyttiomyces sp. JEL0837]|nr:Transmembrane protein 68 [Blyttiomyces sp. JEL0837]